MYVINLDENLVNRLQRLDFSMQMRKIIINDIINENLDNTEIKNSKMYKSYWDEYEECFHEFQMLKMELENKYIPKELKSHNYSWNVDYVNCTFNIKINCDCGKKLYETLMKHN